MKYLILFISIFFIISCSVKKEKSSIQIDGKNLEEQMIESYKAGVYALENGDVLFAAKKFNEAELLYPQSLWAPRSSLMSAYSYYYGSYYVNAIEELNRFIEIYPNHERIVYVYYLLGMCHYEQISDEKNDHGSIIEAQQNFRYV